MQVDGCYADTDSYNETYPELGDALNATGRPIVYSCSWPAYLPDPVQTGFQACPSQSSLLDCGRIFSYQEVVLLYA